MERRVHELSKEHNEKRKRWMKKEKKKIIFFQRREHRKMKALMEIVQFQREVIVHMCVFID